MIIELGMVLSEDSLNQEACWKCENCSKIIQCNEAWDKTNKAMEVGIIFGSSIKNAFP